MEVVHAIAHSNHPVLAHSLIELNTCHTEVHHARLAIFSLQRHIVIERQIKSQQWRERLIDAHLRNIEHATWRRIAGSGILDEAQTIHILLEGAVTVVASNGKHTLIGMIDVHTLEVIAEPRQLT